MEKQTKITYLLFGLLMISVILQKAAPILFEVKGSTAFILTYSFTFGFVISVVQNIFSYIHKGEPKDLWKLGWIGLFGLIGLIPGFSYGFFGFFGSFVFFGAKKWKIIEK